MTNGKARPFAKHAVGELAAAAHAWHGNDCACQLFAFGTVTVVPDAPASCAASVDSGVQE